MSIEAILFEVIVTMSKDADRLLDHLHRGGNWAHYWTPNTGDFYIDKRGERQEGKHSLWFPVDSRPPVPAGWAERNVYFNVYPQTQIPDGRDRRSVKARVAYVAAVNCFFGEFDAKDYGSKAAILEHVDTLSLYPSVVVDSGGGYHCYWLLAEPYAVDDGNRDHVKRVQYAWVDLVGSDGGAKDLARVLRVPGTQNRKGIYAPDYHTVEIVESDFDRLYTLKDFERLTEDLRKPVEPSRAPYTGVTTITDDLVLASECLERLAAHRREDYHEWIAVGMTLTALGDAGLQLWREWSAGSAKYRPGDCDRKWRTFSPNGVGIGTLVGLAYEDDPSFKDERRRQWKEEQTKQYDAEIPTIADVDTVGALDHYLLTQSADDEGNAQCVNRLHGARFLYCDAYGWMENIGTHWQFGGLAEKGVNLSITQTLIDRRIAAVKADKEAIIKATKPSATNKENTKRQFKDIVWCDVSTFDQDKHLLNCQNGVIDLRSGRLVAHGPSDRFTYCVNADYDTDVNMAPWTSYLASVVKDYDLVGEWLQMACGYSITGYTNEEIMFYLFGPTRSGKGTFTNAFLHMLGQPLGQGCNFSTFTAKREGDSQNFDLAPFKPSRFISASESGKYQSLNEAVVKQITGNDPIRASFKGKDQFAFFPQFKIWLSSNHPVRGDVDDDAFWGRVKVIEFPNSHLGREDKYLKEKMQTPEYCSALLAWAVLGARMWYNEPNGLTTPETIAETTIKQRMDLDDVQRWLDECTKIIEGVNTSNADLTGSYREWCDANGVEPKHSRMFGRSMTAKGYESCSVRKPGYNPQRGYRNIALLGAVDEL
jgi:putative DNA primase/helicase